VSRLYRSDHNRSEAQCALDRAPLRERPEIEQDYEQMKSGGWQLKKLSSTRYSEIVFYVLTVVLSYSPVSSVYQHTDGGLDLPTRRARRLPLSNCVPNARILSCTLEAFFEIFETLSFAYFILQLPAAAQDRLRHWLDAHLHMVQQRE